MFESGLVECEIPSISIQCCKQLCVPQRRDLDRSQPEDYAGRPPFPIRLTKETDRDMGTFFLHIGPHKTGTSSIQTFLRANVTQLEQQNTAVVTRNGKMFRRMAFFSNSSMINLSNGIVEGQDWTFVKGKIDEGKNILLSDERFSDSLINKRVLPTLVSFLKNFGYRLVVVSFHRNQVSHLNSCYTQAVKRFRTADSIENYAERQFEFLLYRYSSNVVRGYCERAGVEHRVGLFDYVVRHSTLEDEFLKLIDVSPVGFSRDYEPRNNRNPGTLAILASQLIQKQRTVDTSSENYINITRAFKRYYNQKNWSKSRYQGLSTEMQSRVYEKFYQENDELARNLLNISWDSIVPFKPEKLNVAQYDSLSVADKKDVDHIVEQIVGLIDIAAAA